jgi:hypothetical protein
MSRLEDISKQYREREVVRNDHDFNDEYSGTHPDALSDGDEKGKGEKNGSVGSATDIKTREQQIVRNKFNNNRPYDDSTA